MNKILLLCLISLSLNANTGPAINPNYPDSTENCVTYYTGSGLLRPIIDKFLYNQDFQNNIHMG